MAQFLKVILLLLFVQYGHAQSSHVERGQRYFFQYCSGCHSLNFAPVALAKKIQPPWQNALQNGKWVTRLSEQDAKKWLGRVPPDLSLVGLQHSKSWIMDYLNGFYTDATHPLGRNNRVLLNVMMPDVLVDVSGSRSEIVADIASFLMDIAEPEMNCRLRLGVVVMSLCCIGLFVTWFLRKVYSR